jgi:hypothetical protein
MPAQSETEVFLSSLTDAQLVRFLVRFVYQLSMLARSTYVPGGDGLDDPKLMRLINETIHRATDHADACLAGRTPRRPMDALNAVLFGHDAPAMDRLTRAAFLNAREHVYLSLDRTREELR